MKIFLLLIFALFFITVDVDAATRYASTAGSGSTCSSGSPCSIITAIHNATNGDTILLFAGTYNQVLDDRVGHSLNGMPNNLTIAADPGNCTNFGGYGPSGACANVTITGTTVDGVILLDATGLTFDGIRVDASNAGYGMIIGANGTIKNSEIYNAGLLRSEGGGSGIFGAKVAGVQLLNNFIHDNGLIFSGPAPGHGVYWQGNNGLIANNYFYHNGDFGMQIYCHEGLEDCTAPVLNNNVVRDNLFDGNSVTYGLGGGSLVIYTTNSGTGSRAYNNRFINDHGRALGAASSNSSYGPVAIYNNTVTSFASAGISNSGNNIYKNNIVWHTGSIALTDFYSEGGTITASNNLCSSTGGASWPAGTCSITSDPKFVNPATSDLHLQAVSPAINQGTLTICATCGPSGAAVTITSYSGTTRDIGWDEYIESGSPVQTPELVFSSGADTNSGTTLIDQSGKGHTCTFSTGVTWTTGSKYGTSALSFDGTGYVTCNDSNFLDLTNAMTLEAWVFPTQVESDFRSVMTKGGGSAYQILSSVTGYCGSGSAAGAFIGDDQYVACYSSPLPINIWSHVAVTYDRDVSNPRLLFYVNGTQVATSSANGDILVTSDVLRIGGSEYGEYFRGRIDELRIYNYARSAGQIVTDMGTPITSASPSVTAVRMGTGGIKCNAVSACLKLPGG